MKNYRDKEDRDEALIKLMELRAKFLIERGIEGYDMTTEDAYALIKNDIEGELDEKDIEKRKVLRALIDNMVEFAVCEEYQLFKALPSVNEDINLDKDDIDWEDESVILPYESLCAKYNNTYASVENSDVNYAMQIAAAWLIIDSRQYLTYWTQNDHRVRPWHMALQGFTARKRDFPGWMIPPIEWACRCYLVEDEYSASSNSAKDVMGVTKAPEKPSQLDGIFKESVCQGGRIFSDEHPYFEVDENDKEWLEDFVEDIKKTYYGEEIQ